MPEHTWRVAGVYLFSVMTCPTVASATLNMSNKEFL